MARLLCQNPSGVCRFGAVNFQFQATAPYKVPTIELLMGKPAQQTDGEPDTLLAGLPGDVFVNGRYVGHSESLARREAAMAEAGRFLGNMLSTLEQLLSGVATVNRTTQGTTQGLSLRDAVRNPGLDWQGMCDLLARVHRTESTRDGRVLHGLVRQPDDGDERRRPPGGHGNSPVPTGPNVPAGSGSGSW